VSRLKERSLGFAPGEQTFASLSGRGAIEPPIAPLAPQITALLSKIRPSLGHEKAGQTRPTSLRGIATKAATPFAEASLSEEPVRENCMPRSVRRRSGNWPSYRDGAGGDAVSRFLSI
jgi:hypothetical protein